MSAIYKLRARETFSCPICHWRVTANAHTYTSSRTAIREHMKYEHQISFRRVKLLKSK